MMAVKPISEKPCKPPINLSSNILSISVLEDAGMSDHKIWMGAGACSVSGCPCPSFQETYGSELCNNCGHKYTDHW